MESQKSGYAVVPSTVNELGGERVDSGTPIGAAYVNSTGSGKDELKVMMAEKGQGNPFSQYVSFPVLSLVFCKYPASRAC